MSAENTYEDYNHVHHARLSALTAAAEHFMASGAPCVSVTQSPEHSEGILAAGGLTVPDGRAYAADHEVASTDEEAAAIVDAYNTARVDVAKSDFAGLRTLAWQERAVRLTLAGTAAQDIPRSPLAYAFAEKHTMCPHEGLTIDVIKVHDVCDFDEVARYRFEASDDLVKDVLTIERIDGEIIGVQAGAKPRADENLLRWGKALGQHFDDLVLFLAGAFESEDALDDALASVQQRFVGSAEEGTTRLLMAEIRVRAIAAREAVVLRTHNPGLSLPGSDRLDEWLDRLSVA